MRLRHRLAGVLGSLALAGAAVVAGPVGSASAAACPGTSGVTVIVDTGSSISIRCVSGDPASGLAALGGAGFSVTQVQTQPGFVCRINGSPSKDACRVTPPTTAYWAYWHASRGGSWSYSSRGAGSYNPAPGSVEGWRFGSGQQPRVAPPARTKPAPPKPKSKPVAKTPKPTAPKPPSSRSAKSKSTSTGSTSSGSRTTGSKTTESKTSGSKATGSKSTGSKASGSTSGKATGPKDKAAAAKPEASSSATAKPSASVSPSTTPSGSSSPSPSELDAALAAEASDDPGSSDGGSGRLVAGVALVALLGAAAGLVARRRRA